MYMSTFVTCYYAKAIVLEAALQTVLFSYDSPYVPIVKRQRELVRHHEGHSYRYLVGDSTDAWKPKRGCDALPKH